MANGAMVNSEELQMGEVLKDDKMEAAKSSKMEGDAMILLGEGWK